MTYHVAKGTAKWWEVNLEILFTRIWIFGGTWVNKSKSTLISIIGTTQMKRAGGNCSLFYEFSLLYVLGKTLALLRMSPLMSTFFLKIWLEKGSWHLSQCLFVHLFRLHPILWFIDIVWVSPSLYSKSNCTVKLYKRTKFRPTRPNQLHFLVLIYQFSNLLKVGAYYWYLNRKLPKK